MQLKPCPHCNERIRAEARRCQLCGFAIVAAPPRRWPRALAAVAMFPIGIALAMATVALIGVATAAIVAIASGAGAVGLAMFVIGIAARTPITIEGRARAFRSCISRECRTCAG